MKYLVCLTVLLMAPREHPSKVDFVSNPAIGLQRLKLEGKAGMLLFSADWCPPCKALSEKGFSDEKVAAAAARIIPIYVDMTDREGYKELREQYNITGYPSAIYIDPQGKKIGAMDDREPKGLIKDYEDLAKKYPGKASIWSNSLKFALLSGKTAKKNVVVYTAAEKADFIKLSLKLTKDLGDRKSKSLWVYEQGTEKEASITIYDTQAEDPMKEPTKVTLDDKVETLTKALDEALKKK